MNRNDQDLQRRFCACNAWYCGPEGNIEQAVYRLPLWPSGRFNRGTEAFEIKSGGCEFDRFDCFVFILLNSTSRTIELSKEARLTIMEIAEKVQSTLNL